MGNDDKIYQKCFLHNNSNKNKKIYGLSFLKTKPKARRFIRGIEHDQSIKFKEKLSNTNNFKLKFCFDFIQKTCNVYINNKGIKLVLNQYESTFENIPNKIVPIFSNCNGNSIVSIQYNRSTRME